MSSPAPKRHTAEQRRELLRREVEEVWPLLTYHYGLSPRELAQTPRLVIRAYTKALPRILAQEQLARMEAAIFPKLQKNERQSMVRKLERKAKVREQVSVARNDQEFLGSLGAIGVEMVGPDGEPLPMPAAPPIPMPEAPDA